MRIGSGVSEALPLAFRPEVVVAVWTDPWLRSWGLRFAGATLFILLCHELGHWFACRRYGIPATPPYFLPAPIGLGTFGAFIRIRGAIRSKRELLGVGVAGPIAGFLALLPFLAIGVPLSTPVAAELRAGGVGLAFGESPLLRAAILAVHGTWSADLSLRPHPFLLAAWVGMFATMLNLLPLAQLDGGHVLYAAVGHRQRAIAWPLWAALVGLGFWWPGWWIWAVVVLVLGLRHPRVVDEREPLGPRGRGLVGVAVLLFVLCFMPVPIRLVELVTP